MQAQASYAPNVPDSELPEKVRIGGSDTPAPPTASSVASNAGTRLSNGPETAPPPASQPNDVHVEVDAPLVFNAKNRAAAGALPPPVQVAKDLPVDDSPSRQVHLDTVIQSPPPEPQKKAEHRGFFGRLGGFFSSIFK
jgi:hypothetical protein